jgi:hypothetical protein
MCRSLRHVLSTEGPRRPDGGPRTARRVRPGNVFPARDQARAKAKAFLKSYPKAAYMSEVERWRELPDGAIEFTMHRLRTDGFRR